MATEQWKKYLEENYKGKTGKDLTDDLRNKWEEFEKDWSSHAETALEWFISGINSPEEVKSWTDNWFRTPVKAKKWIDAGVTDATEAKGWKDRNFTPEDAKDWIKEGIKPAYRVDEWKDAGVTKATDAKDWKDKNFTPADAKQWIKAGIPTPKDAKDWEDNKFTPEDAKQWIDAEITKLADAKQWIDAGVESGQVAAEWMRVGVKSAKDAREWIKEEFTNPAYVDSWIQADIKIASLAGQWRDVGVINGWRAKSWMNLAKITDPKVAFKWIAAGAKTPDDANKLREIGITTPEKAKQWMNEEIRIPDQAAEWINLAKITDPKEAKKWIDEGFTTADHAVEWIKEGWGQKPKTIILAGSYEELGCDAKTAAIIAGKTKYLPPERYEEFTDKQHPLEELFKECNGKSEKEIEKILSNIIANINNQQTNITRQLGNSAEAEWAIKVGFDANNLQKIINDSYKINQLRNLSIIRFFVLPDPLKDNKSEAEDKVTAGKIYKLLKDKGFIPKDNKKLQWIHCKENIINFYTYLCKSTENPNNKTYASAKKILELWKLPYSKNDDNKNETNNKAVKKYLMEFLQNYTPEQEAKKS